MGTSMFSGLASLVMMLFVGGGFGLPLGIPPGPEDPVMGRVAPEECQFYLTWSGIGKPEQDGRNQTEQLLAEKEVQECLAQLESLILEAARQGTQNDPQAAAMVEPVAVVVKTVLTHPAAVFISKLDPSAGPRGLRGGAAVNLGPQAADVEQALGKIEKAAAAGAKAPAGPQKWHRLPLGADDLVLEWAVKGKYLIVGVGEGEADQIVVRARQNPPAWLAQVRQQLTVPRPASLVYLNVAGLINAAGPQIPPDGRRVFEALGLDRVVSLVNVTGLDDSGCVSKTQVTVDGEMKGLLSLLTGDPLAKEHLAVIPKDATVAAAARLDLAKVYSEALEVIGRVDPRARDELLGELGQFEESLKIKLAKDIFESLGDVWRVYNSPTEGGLVVTGLTAVVNLRDRDRLVAANGKLVLSALFGGAADRIAGRGRPGPQIGQFPFGSHTVFYLKFAGWGVPFAPSWCITEKELVAALSPQNVKAYLSRTETGGSLADVPAAAALLADEAPMGLAYCDTPGLFKMVYPIVQILVQLARSGLDREGMNLNPWFLPSALAIGRHLQPTVASVRRTKAGVVLQTRQTLPVGFGGFTLPSLLLRATPMRVRPGSFPTMQNTSINNLKQIGLALHNYHDTYRRFPASAGPQKPGQPAVSWRVLVLPFVEQMPLYQQYRFDEPWDSEQNKKVAAQMPPVFKAPGSKAAAQGKTNYLAVVGDRHAFGAEKGRSIAEFIDGTSNTIMVVEVSDEKAVPWTKPEDFTPDPKNPTGGLIGLRPGGFLALWTDGSVRRLSGGIPAGTLNALFTRAGGEIIRPDELDGPAGRVPGAARPMPRRPLPPPAAAPAVRPPAFAQPEPEPKMAAPRNPVQVGGRVTFQGQPVEGATVMLVPRGAGGGRPSTGKTDAAGQFKLTTFVINDGAIPGQYSVLIVKSEAGAEPGAPRKSLLPAKYANPQTSGLTVEVQANGPNEFNFDLRN